MSAVIRGMGNFFTRIVQRYLPDAFIFCLLLTLVAMLGGIFIAGKGPLEVAKFWGNGFWGMLTFSMQSSMAMMTGYALSASPLFRRGLAKVAALPKNFAQAAVLASLSSLLLWYFHWGVGCVATGLLCREITRQMARKGVKIHYPLLVAGSYFGTAVWHNGISGASQLLLATKGHFLEKLVGVIPVSETLFAPGNLFIVVGLFIVIPIVTYFMVPEEKDFKEAPPSLIKMMEEEAAAEQRSGLISSKTFADALNNSVIISAAVAIIGLIFLYFWFAKWNGAFDLNIFIVIMLVAGIIFHYRPSSYFNAMKEGVRAAAPIFLQFQFYGGIMGIMVASGLVAIIANWFVSFSTPFTYPWFTYLGAGLVNLFVPSGGGQWTVQGEIVMRAAKDLGVSLPQAVTAFACGDEWTNLIQPFWALPLLGFAGLGIRDIMGYAAVIFVFSFIVMSIGILFIPW
ncbi:MAG: short-chain fatty acid transporter [Clostridia bacterium]|nr:short-chain fatty acid transporter [Clostridia bacterium]